MTFFFSLSHYSSSSSAPTQQSSNGVRFRLRRISHLCNSTKKIKSITTTSTATTTTSRSFKQIPNQNQTLKIKIQSSYFCTLGTAIKTGTDSASSSSPPRRPPLPNSATFRLRSGVVNFSLHRNPPRWVLLLKLRFLLEDSKTPH